MRVYLASRYSRRVELCEYRDQLKRLGYDVQARWLNGDHQLSSNGTPIGEGGEKLVESDDGSTEVKAAELRSKFANDDWEDVINAELLINFTEPPRVMNSSRGGRHVEFGIALGRGIRVIVIGPRENIFHWLPNVEVFSSWGEFISGVNLE